MADISITPSAVKKGPNASFQIGIASILITAGDAIGRATDGSYARVFANDALNGCDGIALCGCAIGQPFVFATSDGALDFGFSDANAGKNIYVSETGLTFDITDAEGSGNRVMTIGNVNDDGKVTLKILNGATLP